MVLVFFDLDSEARWSTGYTHVAPAQTPRACVVVDRTLANTA